MIIKTCGLRAPDNIRELASLRIDWFGFIGYPKSSRYVGVGETSLATYLDQADIAQERVGVFVDASPGEIIGMVKVLGLTMLQLHGEESPADCEALQRELRQSIEETLPLIKAFRVGEDFDFAVTAQYAKHCEYFLFDTKGKTHGGTGRKFDWSILEKYQGDTPFLLSGGIGPDDAEAVLAFQHPRLVGIDLNSKFETLPAEKDIQKMKTFLHQLDF